MRFLGRFLFGATVAWSCGFAADVPLMVQLTTPLSTSSNHKGDPVSARVMNPPAYQGDIVTGRVTEAKSGNKIHGQAALRFNFDTLQHGGQTVPISCRIESLSNSKGQVNVDEEGRAIRSSSNVGKALGGTGLGALVGGLAGGAKGAAIGAGVGAAASLVLIEVVAEGPKVEFAPGSQIMLSAKAAGGADLASLPPNNNTAVAAPPAPAAPAPAEASPAQAPAASESAPAAGSDQPQLSAVKIDFVPGEKTIFFDDFSDMAGDEPPPHWKVRGGMTELRKGGNVRELVVPNGVDLTSPSMSVPKDFTFELEWTGEGVMEWLFKDKDNRDVLHVELHSAYHGLTLHGPHGKLADAKMKNDTKGVSVFDLWAQQGRIRAYVNGERLIDVNQVDFSSIDHIVLQDRAYKSVGLRSVRVAESAPDFSSVISSTGRYVTHGILFDTDSDRLKPESAAILKQVARGLEKNQNLKLEIDGYTDSTGDPAHNVDLSKRRAEAVRSVLVAQFGIEANRLTANGFGAAKPIGSNDTPEGRAQNRRVEFVKQ